jgi:beta-phosphoglucomutase
LLKAVIFDLDGVITDSAIYHYKAWKQIADRMGIPFTIVYNERLKGVSRMESLNLILDNGKGRDIYSEEEKERLAFEKNENYKELIKQITEDDLLPGIGKLLKELKEKKVQVGLASASRNAMFIIEKLKVDSYFDYIADAGKVENSKPFPDIFLDCIKNLKVEATDSIGIEDAQAGIEAIHRAGMKAVGVGTAKQMREADIILDGTESLTYEMLLQLNQ